MKTRLEAALLALALLLAAPAAWAFDLPELMAQLAKQKSGEANFVEERFVRGVDGPLASAGTLSFTAPDKLARRTQSPRPESMVVDGNTLTLSRAGRTRTLALDSMPELQGMVDALRGTLIGDAQLLQRNFRTQLAGTQASWTLDLQPVDSRLSAQVRSVRLSGRQGQVLGVEMEFVGGDRSVMTISPK
ncbi:outer membrane lipoprotein carrier protein LolA [Variovorax sp. OV329]|uniref:outer membrane lipoprotein carrier protein LolA n=1 Tax=Variovorax sp. OV329 TaxID=1882825 RepID=UPI000B140CD8|nr:outer membrane lipoprotein carrier protein LolA [Variovorax sp. OV329]